MQLVCYTKGSKNGRRGGSEEEESTGDGGNGQVGGSTLRALSTGGDLHLIVGRRNRYHIFACCTPAYVSCCFFIIHWMYSSNLSSWLPCSNLNPLAIREKREALVCELGGSVEFLGFDMDNPLALRAAIDGMGFFTSLNHKLAFQPFGVI